MSSTPDISDNNNIFPIGELSVIDFAKTPTPPTIFIAPQDLLFYNAMFMDENIEYKDKNKDYYGGVIVSVSTEGVSPDSFNPYSSYNTLERKPKHPPFPVVPEAEYYGLIMFSMILFIVFFGGLRSRRKINK